MAASEQSFRYFAYGSNLSPLQMVKRFPSAQAVGPAILKHHQLVFPRYSHNWKCGVAGVEPLKDHSVHGVVYELSATCLKTLDRHEGVHVGRYRRETIRVQFVVGGDTTCAIYMANNEPDGHYPPNVEYIATMLRGAEYHGLSDQWITKLKTLQQ